MLGNDKVRQGFFGQEINLTTYNLCRINMFLHDVNFEKFDIATATLFTDPAHWDDEPFTRQGHRLQSRRIRSKWDGDANPLLINDPRFAPGRRARPQEQGRPGLHTCTSFPGWRSAARAIVEFPACFIAAVQSRRSANT